MAENLREVVSLIGQAAENPVWDSHEPRGARIEGLLGSAIQVLVQSHLRTMRQSGILPQGRVNVDTDVVLDFRSLELSSTRHDRFDRTVGGRDWPMGPYAWLRNYQGILDQITRISGEGS